MSAPLRKMVSSDAVQTRCEMSKRGGTVTVKWDYDVIYALECGHKFRVKHSKYRPTDSKRCKKCVEVSK